MKIEHVALLVKDLEKTREFYTKYFGVKAGDLYYNNRTGLKTYFLSFDSGARLEIMQRPESVGLDKSQMYEGLVHLALSVGSKEAVDELTARLKEDGYTVTSGSRTTGDGYYESTVLDCEMNTLEITV